MLSRKLADIIAQNSNLPQEDRTILEYGLKKIISLMADLIFTVILGVLLKIAVESIIFYFSFMLLRMYAGGYHSKTELQCKIHSVIVTILSLAFVRVVPDMYGCNVFLMLLSSIMIAFMAPVEAVNKPLSDAERKINRRVSLMILLILNVLSVVSLILHWNYYHRAAMAALLAVLILMIMGKLSGER